MNSIFYDIIGMAIIIALSFFFAYFDILRASWKLSMKKNNRLRRWKQNAKLQHPLQRRIPGYSGNFLSRKIKLADSFGIHTPVV